MTTLEDPFKASLCTLEGSLLDDLEDLDFVLGWDMVALVVVVMWERCCEEGVVYVVC